MLYIMKTYVELSLVAILIVLLYQPPISVTLFAKSVLGKALLIMAIVATSHFFGMNAGLLTAIIVVVLLNHTVEGADAALSATDQAGVFPRVVWIVVKIYSLEMYRIHVALHVKRVHRNCNTTTQSFKNMKEGMKDRCNGNVECLRGSSAEERPPLTPQQKAKAEKAAAAAGVQLDNFSNYTLDNAADFANLKSTITALDTNENIKRSMRASEYAKTAPAGSTLMTNHLDTAAVVNNNSPSLAGIL